MYQIMIGVDGSEAALHAVRHGLRLLQAGLQGKITLVEVQREASLLELVTQDADAIAQAAVQAGRHLMEPAAALLEAAAVPYEMEVVLGEPGAMLQEMAENLEADLVIVGARGMGAIKSAWLGSVSQRLLQHCSKPVVVVKPPQEDGAAAEAAAIDGGHAA